MLSSKSVLQKSLAVVKFLLKNASTQAEIDASLRDGFTQQIYKPRRHPGTMRQKTVVFPEDILKAVKIVLGDNHPKIIYQNAIKLDNYIRSRHPPPEEKDIDAITSKLDSKISRKNISEEDLKETDLEKLEKSRQMKLFNMLKKRVYHWANIDFDENTRLQYLMCRTPAEYAALCRIFDEIDARVPDFKPRSFFDFGSGVGSGTWAVRKYWKEHIFEYFSVDTSPQMHDLARLLLCGGRENVDFPIKGFFQRQFLPASSTNKYDIVLSAFSLFEMPNMKSRLETIQKLWNKTQDFLVIVEYGSNAGFRLVNEARDFILNMSEGKRKAHVFSPCPNDNVCPRYLEQDTPCNFLIKFNTFPYPSKSEIKADLFSYVVLRRGPRPDLPEYSWPRIVRPPLVRSRHTICRMCTHRGELQEVIFTKSKHEQDAYRCARSSCWGDLLPVTIQPDERSNMEDDS